MPCWTTSQYMARLGNRAELWSQKLVKELGVCHAKWFKPQKDDFLTSRLAVENWKIAIIGSNIKVVLGRTQTYTRRVADKWQEFCILKMQFRDHWNFSLKSHQWWLIIIIVMCIKNTYRTNTGILGIIIIIIIIIVIIIITRPKPAYGRQGLAGLWG